MQEMMLIDVHHIPATNGYKPISSTLIDMENQIINFSLSYSTLDSFSRNELKCQSIRHVIALIPKLKFEENRQMLDRLTLEGLKESPLKTLLTQLITKYPFFH